MTSAFLSSFAALPNAPRLRLANVSAPACLLPQSVLDRASPEDIRDGLLQIHLDLVDGKLAAVTPALASSASGDMSAPYADMRRAIVMPAFVDMHTHLDKGHIWSRSPNPDGTFDGALQTVAADRSARWSAADVKRRMNFALECAYAYGTRAIRTHLDSIPPQPEISWPVFREMRDRWRGRIELQASCLVGIDRVDDTPEFRALADLVAESGGVLGAVAYPIDDIDRRLDVLFRLAAERGLNTDFHVDETGDPTSAGLRAIAEAKLRNRFAGKVVCGHCCSLAVQDEPEAGRTMDLVAEAGLAVVSLPMCNMYLQARDAGQTPRWRGVTLVHEMAARGTAVSFASDNTRDPFYAYGDLDMIEVMREATRIAHLDHTHTDWPKAFTTTPAETCGFEAQLIERGAPADLVFVRARNWTEFFARPQSDRIVMRDGRQIERLLPDYSQLDDLMETV